MQILLIKMNCSTAYEDIETLQARAFYFQDTGSEVPLHQPGKVFWVFHGERRGGVFPSDFPSQIWMQYRMLCYGVEVPDASIGR